MFWFLRHRQAAKAQTSLQSRYRISCLHAQRVGVDEDTDQNLGF